MNITKAVSIKKIKLIKKAVPGSLQTKDETPPLCLVETEEPPPVLKVDPPQMPPPPNMRCIAICADKQQCTRVKKRGCLLCGTHAKTMASADTENQKMLAIEVWVEEINGIVYYFDKNGNVYDTEDVLENRQNPRIIGRYSGASPNICVEFI